MHRKLVNKNLINFAKNNRKSSTKAETKLWSILKNRNLNGYKFRRQEVIKKYIVDFICYEKSLIIELDGGQHNEKSNELLDEERTEHLKKEGFEVLRFWNNEVLENIDGVANIILKVLNKTKPSP